jgi:hypothetical protein
MEDRSGIEETKKGGLVEGEPSNTPPGEFDNEAGAYAI